MLQTKQQDRQYLSITGMYSDFPYQLVLDIEHKELIIKQSHIKHIRMDHADILNSHQNRIQVL